MTLPLTTFTGLTERDRKIARIEKSLDLQWLRRHRANIIAQEQARELRARCRAIRLQVVGKLFYPVTFRQLRIIRGCDAKIVLAGLRDIAHLPDVFQLILEQPMASTSIELIHFKSFVRRELQHKAAAFTCSLGQLDTIQAARSSRLKYGTPYRFGYQKDILDHIETAIETFEMMITHMTILKEQMTLVRRQIAEDWVDNKEGYNSYMREQWKYCCIAYQSFLTHAPLRYFNLAFVFAQALLAAYE